MCSFSFARRKSIGDGRHNHANILSTLKRYTENSRLLPHFLPIYVFGDFSVGQWFPSSSIGKKQQEHGLKCGAIGNRPLSDPASMILDWGPGIGFPSQCPWESWNCLGLSLPCPGGGPRLLLPPLPTLILSSSPGLSRALVPHLVLPCSCVNFAFNPAAPGLPHFGYF